MTPDLTLSTPRGELVIEGPVGEACLIFHWRRGEWRVSIARNRLVAFAAGVTMPAESADYHDAGAMSAITEADAWTIVRRALATHAERRAA